MYLENSLSHFIISYSWRFGSFVGVSLISRLSHYLVMDSQSALPLYTSFIEGDIDIDSPLLGVSQNNPMLVSNSSPEIEIITTNKGKRGVNFSVDEDKLYYQHGSILVSISCMVMS